MMNHLEVLNSAVDMLKVKGQLYGPEETCFERISLISSVVLGKNISPFDVAMIHHATKLARIQSAPAHKDNYVDGINYMAFAAQFMTRGESSGDPDETIRKMARSLAPMPQATPLSDVMPTSDN